MYELQEEGGKPSLVGPESNDDGRGSDLLDVCDRFLLEASSYERAARVAVEHAAPLIQL